MNHVRESVGCDKKTEAKTPRFFCSILTFKLLDLE
jgi:hypothetical protein